MPRSFILCEIANAQLGINAPVTVMHRYSVMSGNYGASLELELRCQFTKYTVPVIGRGEEACCLPSRTYALGKSENGSSTN
jgi:hypothetical protein